jgi:hypothetical protein
MGLMRLAVPGVAKAAMPTITETSFPHRFRVSPIWFRMIRSTLLLRSDPVTPGNTGHSANAKRQLISREIIEHLHGQWPYNRETVLVPFYTRSNNSSRPSSWLYLEFLTLIQYREGLSVTLYGEFFRLQTIPSKSIAMFARIAIVRRLPHDRDKGFVNASASAASSTLFFSR